MAAIVGSSVLEISSAAPAVSMCWTGNKLLSEINFLH